MLRITTGILKGLELDLPSAEGLRPTTPRIREAIFNSIQAELTGCSFLDAFAGSGAIAFTALSRGALKVIGLESDPTTHRYLTSVMGSARERIKKQSILPTPKIELILGKAKTTMAKLLGTGEMFDFIYLDPPFQQSLVLLTGMFGEVSQLSAPGGRLIVELPKETVEQTKLLFTSGGFFILSKSLDYGSRVILFFDRDEIRHKG